MAQVTLASDVTATFGAPAQQAEEPLTPAVDPSGRRRIGPMLRGARVGVLVVAYNAATTLARTLDRLPDEFLAEVDHILVCDDASEDTTYQVGLAYQKSSPLPLSVVRHPQNLGYGGNQKAGYDWAISHGLDVVVLLHGDGQYAPEHIADMVEPLLADEADAVFGSRMLTPGAARAGGMPAYKLVGNRILTTVQNSLTGLRLSEWHSGYRAYRVEALKDLDFHEYSSDFDFDTEIILGLHAAGKRIVEVPVPTFYGDEICYVNGIKYAKDVTKDVLAYRARKVGFGRPELTNETAYALKPSAHSSHGVLLRWLGDAARGRVLDVGCSDGQFGAHVRALGHAVVGVDMVAHPGVEERLNGFAPADLNAGLPASIGAGFDIAVAADVLEHVTDPAALLHDIMGRLAPGGRIFVSVPNFAHWYPRTRVALGMFDYDQRGPLDRGHVRFFTRRSFERLVGSVGLGIVRRETTGTPFDIVTPPGAAAPIERAVGVAGVVDRQAVRAWPTMFGYQFLYELTAD